MVLFDWTVVFVFVLFVFIVIVKFVNVGTKVRGLSCDFLKRMEVF